MANVKKRKVKGFQFKPFSEKQKKVLNWWHKDSPVNDMFMVIADGSVRAGKTICMALSFVMFVMNNFNQMDALMAGKSVGTFRRNVLNPLKQMLIALNYQCIEHRSENYIEVSKGEITNYLYIAGAKDESSQDYIQGMTLCAVLLDEVALLPESFFNQATARMSVDGAKLFCNCNPASPYHWFYKNILKHTEEKKALYIHFTMDDNLSLSERVKQRYETMYSGVFYKRYIRGLWVNAEGRIYDMFTNEKNVVKSNEIPYDEAIKWCVGVDYGTGNATVFLLCMKTFTGDIYVVREYYFEGRKEAIENGDYDNQKTDLEFTDDMVEFLGQTYEYTQIPYNKMDIVVDPAAASFKVQLHRSGMRTKDARNAVIDGIRDVASYIGEGKLKVSTECKNLLREINTYVWDDKAQERGIDRPLKRNDHCISGDTLIYTVEGYKAIQDLVGQTGMLYSVDENNNECVRRFYNVRKTQENVDTIKLIFDKSELVCTPDHLIKTTCGWVEAKDLDFTYDVITLTGITKLLDKYSYEKMDVYNLEVEDTHCFVVADSNICIHNCVDALRYSIEKLKDKNSIKDAAKNVGI